MIRYILDARFEVFMVVKIQVNIIIWVMIPCSVVLGYHFIDSRTSSEYMNLNFIIVSLLLQAVTSIANSLLA